ncbi:hypothetical protein D3C80_1429910 [compost metagenome]
MEAENLELSGVSTCSQLIAQLEPAFKFAFFIAFCRSDIRVDNVAIILNFQVELKAAIVRYLHRIKSSNKSER